MTTGKEVARRGPGAVVSTGAADGVRASIQEALSAYELAVATRLRAEREATHAHGEHKRALTERERQATSDRQHDQQALHSVAAADASRIAVLAELAAQTADAAVRLLDSSALAHVRGVGDGLAVQPHTATDEQAAAAFTAAATAAVDLHAALLRLATAHRESGDWERAREILIPLRAATSGPLHNAATELLYATYLEQAAATNAAAGWEQARQLIDSALEIVPGGLTTDPVLAAEFLLATGQGVDAALAAERRDDAERLIGVARERLGADHPQVRRWTRRPALGWTGGQAACLQEFGGHSQPVKHAAFTADGEQLVSVDGSQIKRWQMPGTSGGGLLTTIVAPGAFQLTGAARLAVTADGALLSTDDGTMVSRIAGATAGSVTSFASTPDGSAMAWAVREEDPSRKVNLGKSAGFTVVGPSGYGPVSPADAPLATLLASGAIPSQVPLDAIRVGGAKQVSVYPHTYQYQTAALRLVDTVLMNSLTGEQGVVNVNPKALWLRLALSSAADFVAWLDPVGQVVITDIATRIVRHAFQSALSHARYDAIAISPRDQLVIVTHAQHSKGAWQSTVTAWEVATGRQVCSWEVPGTVSGIAISPDERLIAALNTAGVIGLYDIRAQSALRTIGPHGALESPCVAFSPDGSRLVTSGDRTIKVWGVP
jgi:WD40 repeat protein